MPVKYPLKRIVAGGGAGMPASGTPPVTVNVGVPDEGPEANVHVAPGMGLPPDGVEVAFPVWKFRRQPTHATLLTTTLFKIQN